MSLYLFEFKGKAAILDVPIGLSVTRWARLQEEFALAAVPRRGFRPQVNCVRLWPDQRVGPVYWDESLAGPSGMEFHLLPMPGATKEDTTAAKSHLRANRDVVRIRVCKITSWLPMGSIRYQIEPPKALSTPT